MTVRSVLTTGRVPTGETGRHGGTTAIGTIAVPGEKVTSVVRSRIGMIVVRVVRAATAIVARAGTGTVARADPVTIEARAGKAATAIVARAVRADTGTTVALDARGTIADLAVTIAVPIGTVMTGVHAVRVTSVVRSGIGMIVVRVVRAATAIGARAGTGTVARADPVTIEARAGKAATAIVVRVRAVSVIVVRVVRAVSAIVVRVVRAATAIVVKGGPGTVARVDSVMTGVRAVRVTSVVRSGIGMIVVRVVRAATAIGARVAPRARSHATIEALVVKAATAIVVRVVKAATVIVVRVVKAATVIVVRVVKVTTVIVVRVVKVTTVIVVRDVRAVSVIVVRVVRAATAIGVKAGPGTVARAGSVTTEARVVRAATAADARAMEARVVAAVMATVVRASAVPGVRVAPAARSRGMTAVSAPAPRAPVPGTAGPTGRTRLRSARSCPMSRSTSPRTSSTRKSAKNCVPSLATSPSWWAGTSSPLSGRSRTTTPTGRTSTRRWHAGSRPGSASYVRPPASSPTARGTSPRR
ncbi:hypothetical protein [Nonomuraea sp. NPDC049400]|uniref:hypothetical protein n=1 Tax=Nonomuraea sp. NPDC049400 TaxID=3364352 RepID=UPI00378A8D6B